MSEDEQRETFLTPIFRGKRFENNTMPVESLADLASYKELVLEVAKLIWREHNPRRERLPKHWSDGLQLYIVKIERGSACPVLYRENSPKVPLENADPDVFERAREIVSEAIQASQQNLPLPKIFAPYLFSYFDRIGQGLRPDESIELQSPKTKQGPIYRAEDRRKLLATGRTLRHEHFNGVGEILTISVGSNLSVDLRLTNGQIVNVPLANHYRMKLAEHMKQERPRMRIECLAAYDYRDQIVRMSRVGSVQFLEPRLTEFDLNKRILELEGLKPGWLDGEGEKLPPSALARVRLSLAKWHKEYEIPIPYIYPTVEGEISIEWPLDGWAVSATINLTSWHAYLHATSLDSDGCEDEQIETADDADFEQLPRFVRRFIQGDDE